MMQVTQEYVQVDDELIILYPPEEPGNVDGLLGIFAQMIIRIAKEQSCITPTDHSAA